jgi:hypothetical protein
MLITGGGIIGIIREKRIAKNMFLSLILLNLLIIILNEVVNASL